MVACAAALSMCLCLRAECGNKFEGYKAHSRITVIKNFEAFDPQVVVAASAVLVTAGAAIVMTPPLYENAKSNARNADSNAILADNDSIRTKAAHPEADLLKPGAFPGRPIREANLGAKLTRNMESLSSFFNRFLRLCNLRLPFGSTKDQSATTDGAASQGQTAAVAGGGGEADCSGAGGGEGEGGGGLSGSGGSDGVGVLGVGMLGGRFASEGGGEGEGGVGGGGGGGAGGGGDGGGGEGAGGGGEGGNGEGAGSEKSGSCEGGGPGGVGGCEGEGGSLISAEPPPATADAALTRCQARRASIEAAAKLAGEQESEGEED